MALSGHWLIHWPDWIKQRMFISFEFRMLFGQNNDYAVITLMVV